MSEVYDAVRAANMLERMGFDLSKYCTLPDCYCDGGAHPEDEPDDLACSESDLGEVPDGQ